MATRPCGLAAAATCAAAAPAFVPALRPGGAPRALQSVAAPRGATAGPAQPRPADSAAGAAAGLALAGASLAAAGLLAGRLLERRAGRATAARAKGRAAFDPAAQVGAVAPLGFFDPLGFASDRDEEKFRILREAELKHGRVAMIASVGLVGQHFLKLPGAEAVPAGLGALGTAVGQVGLAAVFMWSGVMETTWKQEAAREVGDFGDPLGVGMYDEDMRNKELNNGRFAMICVVGILAAELATGKDAIQQFGL